MTEPIRRRDYRTKGTSDWAMWWNWVKACRAGKRTARQRRRASTRTSSDDTVVAPRIVDSDCRQPS